jgi:two-component system nitrogen regulation sensor histidine kinase GlnL
VGGPLSTLGSDAGASSAIRQEGLDLLSTAVIVLDHGLVVIHANPAAEDLFHVSRLTITGHRLEELMAEAEPVSAVIAAAAGSAARFTQHDVVIGLLAGAAHRVRTTLTVTPWETGAGSGFLLELVPLRQQLKIAREERLLDQTQVNRELIRNLAHEIKNPLGALRGAAQLLDRELERPALHEYTQVIMAEADRLQALMDRLLTPHRPSQPMALNIHEVTERVRSLILAEFPGVRLIRDYDTSLPSLIADREQLIQAVLNVARNAAQALKGRGTITLKSRVARRVTLARRVYRLAILLQVIDDGPGIAEELRERVFFPLVSGREGGTGLGLTLAQTFVTQHQGIIEVDSQPGNTCFSILLPLRDTALGAGASPATNRP